MIGAHRRIALSLLVIVAGLIWSGAAQASMADMMGLGGRSVAMVNATMTTATAVDACYLNPAALALMSRGFKASFGYQGIFASLDSGSNSLDIQGGDGILAGIAGVIPLGSFLKDRLGVGLQMYLPRKYLMWMHLHFSDDPHFPLYENRYQRLVLRPALGIRIYEEWAVGVSVNYYVDLAGYLETRGDSTRSLAARGNLELFSNVTADFNVTGEILPGWKTSFMFRMEHFSDADFLTKNQIADLELNLDIDGTTLFEPASIEFATSYDAASIGLLAEFGFIWRFWSDYPGSYTILDAEVPSGTMENKKFTPNHYDIGARDTWELKLGLEQTLGFSHGISLLVRGGYAYESTAIAEQTGRTNMLDSDHHKFGFGLGVSWATGWDLLQRLGLDIGAQLHYMPDVTHTKDESLLIDESLSQDGVQSTNAGYPSITGGGIVAGLACSVSIEL